MPLEEYEAKRHPGVTPEPFGGKPAGPGEPLRFVVHKHAARALHYDFRLELDGVLMSWAIPKGPSYDPKDKRLAVHVEDHPIDYGDFEGTIPAGEYGAGSVIIWDHGTWEPIAPPGGVADAHAGMAKGDFKFRLSGNKLVGNWVLVRLKPRPGEKRENWLLIKERDDHIRAGDGAAILAERPESVVSGLTIEEVAERGAREASGAGDDKEGEQPGGATPSAGTPPAAAGAAGSTARPIEAPLVAPPELALCTLVTEPPTGDDWLVEVKYDGFRVTVALDHGRAQVFERSGGDATERFAAVARAASALPVETALIDGEAVVFDEAGISRFGLLVDDLGRGGEKATLVAFDLLHLNGYDLTALSTTARRDLLATVLAEAPADGPLRLASHIAGDAPAFLEAACAQGLEGIVAKRADAPYPRGRTRAWVKVKCRRTQDFVVIGATEPRSGRTGFGALLVAYHDADGQLTYAGRVGSGFSAAELSRIDKHLRSIEVAEPPVSPEPPERGAAVARWVRPEMVVEVAFAEWTGDGRLRQPSFLRERPDVSPADVKRVEPVAPPLPDEAAVAPEPTPTAPASGAAVAGVRISNPDKRLFPESELTKLELARYYETVAPLMLREAAERPLTLVRCPVGDGAQRGCFYQRHPERGLPTAVHTLVHTLAEHAEPDEWVWVDDVAGLVSLAQMGCAEVHSWLSRTDHPNRPDRLVFDLDPGPGVTWPQIAKAARDVRAELESLGFAVYVKSTGSKGLHVVAPVEPVWEFNRMRALAKTIAERIALAHPDELTPKMAKSKRERRIFLDYVRNSEAASAVLPYSTRFLPGPSIAVPLAFDELTDDLDVRAFTPAVVAERVSSGIDPWASMDDSAVGSRVLKAAEGRLF